MIVETSAKIMATAQCPYCGHKNIIVATTTHGIQIVLCDPDDGGCDKYFVANHSTTVEVRSHRIEESEAEPCEK